MTDQINHCLFLPQAKRAKNTALLALVDKDYFSWKTLNQLVNGPVFDQALRDMLNSYVPFEPSSMTNGGTIFSSRTLQQDCIDLAGVKVGTVFNGSLKKLKLNVKSAFFTVPSIH